uniref:CHK kinase-like domain-containing protein n=1 Tax=Scylla olivacea TaxID=85551 RepID=A0A0P4VVZ1_SCYOL
MMKRIGDKEVQQVLQRDQGSHARLITWSHEPLASKLDGATSNIFNLKVKFEAAGKEGEVCYAAKISNTREIQPCDFQSLIFVQESRFYQEVIPALSSVLEEVKEKPLSFPKCYYISLQEGKEVLILENLKAKGYLMKDKALGLDLAHTCLVMKALGKLHAASFLLQTKLTEDITEKFDFYKKEWTHAFNWGSDWGGFMDKFLKTGLTMFKEMGDCEKVTAWLRRVKPEVWPRYKQMLERKAPFDVITHGDPWINNMFFRYDEAGQPEEVVLFDMQGTRVCSLALDLNHFINLNVTGKVRRANFDTIIATYYDSFSSVVNAKKIAVPFTLEELKQEYIDKGFYGVLYAIMYLPCMVSNDEDSFVFGDEEKWQAAVKRMVKENPLLHPTILSVVDEWIERGVIS